MANGTLFYIVNLSKRIDTTYFLVIESSVCFIMNSLRKTKQEESRNG